MTARATRDIHGPLGSFLRGQPITGVPEPVVSAWIADGAAETADAPPPERPAPAAETATRRAPERATRRK